MAVVWAEDADADQYLIRTALAELPKPPRVRFAHDGGEALQEIAKTHPALVVLDINMPNVNGIEALRRLRADAATRNVPVVMFSTAKNDDEVKTCEDLGVAGFVQKPSNFDEFAKAVKGIIDLAA